MAPAAQRAETTKARLAVALGGAIRLKPRKHGGDQAHGEFHRVLGVRTQVMLRKQAAKPHPDPHSGEQAN